MTFNAKSFEQVACLNLQKIRNSQRSRYELICMRKLMKTGIIQKTHCGERGIGETRLTAGDGSVAAVGVFTEWSPKNSRRTIVRRYHGFGNDINSASRRIS